MFPCVPLMKCESRRPVIAESEKRMVARKAASIARSVEIARASSSLFGKEKRQRAAQSKTWRSLVLFQSRKHLGLRQPLALSTGRQF